MRRIRHWLLLSEVELEEVIGDLGSTLAGEHKHGVSGHGEGKVTAGGRDVAYLAHLQAEKGNTVLYISSLWYGVVTAVGCLLLAYIYIYTYI